MGFADYKKDLLARNFDSNCILDRYFDSGESHVFAGAMPDEEARLKGEVARALHSTCRVQIHPRQLVVCGSAHLGFSPIPEKLGKAFSPEDDDLDIAVISVELFDAWWMELQGAGLDDDLRADVSRDIFSGFINPAKVSDASSHGSRWREAFDQLQTDRARRVCGRLYRRFWSMQTCHRQAVVQGRARLLREEEGVGQYLAETAETGHGVLE